MISTGFVRLVLICGCTSYLVSGNARGTVIGVLVGAVTSVIIDFVVVSRG